jgi:hypothetical protein
MDAKANANAPSDEQNARERKKYVRPELVVYGDIHAITRSVSPTGMGDGAMAGNAKT